MKKDYTPTPGIEPGPPGWKPGILAIRPRGIVEKKQTKYKTWLSNFCCAARETRHCFTSLIFQTWNKTNVKSAFTAEFAFAQLLRECQKNKLRVAISLNRSHGVMVSTLDFESSDPSSNLGGTFNFIYTHLISSAMQLGRWKTNWIDGRNIFRSKKKHFFFICRIFSIGMSFMMRIPSRSLLDRPWIEKFQFPRHI